MKTLALEFSSDLRSVAVTDQHNLLANLNERGGRETRAFALIESALRQAGCEREAITQIAVGLGPGSYTGIRAALAIAQGWELARNVEVVGVSSMACVAAQLALDEDRGRAGILVDAQRGDFYLLECEWEGGSWRELEPLRIVPRSEIEARARAGTRMVGPDAAKVPGAAREIYPDAGVLARLAQTDGKYLASKPLEPIYLRPIAFVKAPPPRFPLP